MSAKFFIRLFCLGATLTLNNNGKTEREIFLISDVSEKIIDAIGLDPYMQKMFLVVLKIISFNYDLSWSH